MKVIFVSSGNEKCKPSPIVKSQGESLINNGISLSYFTINNKGFKGYFFAIKHLRNNLRLNKYDIIHAHYGLSAFVALLAKQKEKLVVSYMGDDIVGSNRFNGSITVSSQLLSMISILFTKWFYNYSIVKTKEMFCKIADKKASIIPNGVDVMCFYPIDKKEARNKLGINNYEKIVIFVSNPDRAEKNYQLAEKAFKHCSFSNLKLFPVYGIEHSKLVFYYNAADVLVLTSFHEGSPNVIKEAMACNCPIVSTDVGDVRWLVGDTEGCFVASFNPQEFSEKLKKALNFSELKDRTNGRERILELGLDSETVAKRIINIYTKVLS